MIIPIKNIIELNQISTRKKHQVFSYNWKNNKRYVIQIAIKTNSSKWKYFVWIVWASWISSEFSKVEDSFFNKNDLISFIWKEMKKNWYKDDRDLKNIWKVKNIVYDKEFKDITLDELNEVFIENEKEMNYREKREMGKIKQRIKDKELKKEQIWIFKLNDIVVTSWGYNQTNVNAYQIVKIHKSNVSLKEVDVKVVKKTWYDSDRVIPVKNSFSNSNIIQKRIWRYWISIDSYQAKKWDWKESYYRSSYA